MSKNTTKRNRHIVEQLTPQELDLLKSKVLGYGNFTRTADEANLPKPTLRDVILRGRGIPATIKKVRKYLKSAA